jgi:hypothetical protein
MPASAPLDLSGARLGLWQGVVMVWLLGCKPWQAQEEEVLRLVGGVGEAQVVPCPLRAHAVDTPRLAMASLQTIAMPLR